MLIMFLSYTTAIVRRHSILLQSHRRSKLPGMSSDSADPPGGPRIVKLMKISDATSEITIDGIMREENSSSTILIILFIYLKHCCESVISPMLFIYTQSNIFLKIKKILVLLISDI